MPKNDDVEKYCNDFLKSLDTDNDPMGQEDKMVKKEDQTNVVIKAVKVDQGKATKTGKATWAITDEHGKPWAMLQQNGLVVAGQMYVVYYSEFKGTNWISSVELVSDVMSGTKKNESSVSASGDIPPSSVDKGKIYPSVILSAAVELTKEIFKYKVETGEIEKRIAEELKKPEEQQDTITDIIAEGVIYMYEYLVEKLNSRAVK